jgi:hypothetical protein
LFGSLTVATSPVAAEYLAGKSGILIIVGYGLLAAWLLSRRNLGESSRAARGGVAIPRAAQTAP